MSVSIHVLLKLGSSGTTTHQGVPISAMRKVLASVKCMRRLSHKATT